MAVDKGGAKRMHEDCQTLPLFYSSLDRTRIAHVRIGIIHAMGLRHASSPPLLPCRTSSVPATWSHGDADPVSSNFMSPVPCQVHATPNLLAVDNLGHQ